MMFKTYVRTYIMKGLTNKVSSYKCPGGIFFLANLL